MTSVVGNTRKRSHSKSAESASADFTSRKMIETISSKQSTDSKKTTNTNTKVVNKLVDLTFSDDNGESEFDIENYHGDKSSTDFHNDILDDNCSNLDEIDKRDNIEDSFEDYNPKSETYLTKKEFDYTMELVNTKITSIYRLCKFIADIQQEEKKSLNKLVALDELSDTFWNVSYLTYLTFLF